MPKKDEEEAAGRGHNRVQGEELRDYLDRVERIREDKAALAEDEKLIFQEAKAKGYAPDVMREVLKLRAMDTERRDDKLSLMSVYIRACGLGPWLLDDEEEDEFLEDGKAA